MIYQPSFICCCPMIDLHGTLTLSSTSAGLVFHNMQHWDKPKGFSERTSGLNPVLEEARGTWLCFPGATLISVYYNRDFAVKTTSGQYVAIVALLYVCSAKSPQRSRGSCSLEWCCTLHTGRAAQPWWQGVRYLGAASETAGFGALWGLPIVPVWEEEYQLCKSHLA